jgi:hypothetical protein
MSDTDRAFLEKLRDHAADTRTFLGNKMKPERERSVCRAFLRAIGVPFIESELIAPTVEPADVAFRDARFQVRDLLRERKRGDEWKNKQKRYADVQSLSDLGEPYSSPVPTGLKSLVPEVTTALSEKATKYGAGCKDLDALIYVDLPDTFLEANSSFPGSAELQHQGWRSVSLLYSPYGVVVLVKKDAPAFLRDAAGKTHMKWANIDTLFEARRDS